MSNTRPYNAEIDCQANVISKGELRDKKILIKNLRFLSGQLTERVRFLSVSVIAACWAISNGNNVSENVLILISMGMAFFVIIFDYLQYLSQYAFFSKNERSNRRNNDIAVYINTDSLLYKLRWVFFNVKIFLVTLLAPLFLVTIFIEIVTA